MDLEFSPKLFAAQVRAARAFLNWSGEELSRRAGLHRNTIGRIERGLSCDQPNRARLVDAFSNAGIEIHGEQAVRFGFGPGIRVSADLIHDRIAVMQRLQSAIRSVGDPSSTAEVDFAEVDAIKKRLDAVGLSFGGS